MKAFFLLTKNRLGAMPRFQRVFYLACLALIALYGFSVFAFSARYPWNYVNIGIGVLMAVALLVYEFVYHEIKIDEYVFLLFAFCWMVLLTSLINGAAGGISKSLFTQAAFGAVLFQFVKERDHLRDALLAFLAGGTAFVLYFVVHYRSELLHFSLNNSLGRLGDYFDNENNVARDFVFLGLLSFYLAICKKQWWLLLYTLAMLFLTLTTGSISNLSCFLFAMFVMAIFVARGRKKWIVLGATLGLVAAGFLLIQLPQLSYFQKRIMNMLASLFGASSGDASATERFELARDAFLFFLDSPILGHGYNYVTMHTVGSFAHNNFFEILASFGIFALLFYEALLLLPLLRMRKAKGSMEKFLFALLIYLFVFQIFLVTYYQKIDHIVLALAFGLVAEKDVAAFTISLKDKKLTMGFAWNLNSRGKEKLMEKIKTGESPLDVDHYRIGE